jgi:hypothetical protein
MIEFLQRCENNVVNIFYFIKLDHFVTVNISVIVVKWYRLKERE